MSTSERTFNQVKAILGKLDQSINQAREKRLHADPPTTGKPVIGTNGATAQGVPGGTASDGRPVLGRAQAIPLERAPGSGLNRAG